MGLWNSHTSLGNILGSLVAGAFVNYNWGLSFTVPGLIIAGVGFTIFLCLVPRPQEAGLASQAGEQASQQVDLLFLNTSKPCPPCACPAGGGV